MEDDPISLSADLARNIGVFRDRFGASGNADIIIRDSQRRVYLRPDDHRRHDRYARNR